jgi:hypothetical protein
VIGLRRQLARLLLDGPGDRCGLGRHHGRGQATRQLLRSSSSELKVASCGAGACVRHVSWVHPPFFAVCWTAAGPWTIRRESGRFGTRGAWMAGPASSRWADRFSLSAEPGAVSGPRIAVLVNWHVLARNSRRRTTGPVLGGRHDGIDGLPDSDGCCPAGVGRPYHPRSPIDGSLDQLDAVMHPLSACHESPPGVIGTGPSTTRHIRTRGVSSHA